MCTYLHIPGRTEVDEGQNLQRVDMVTKLGFHEMLSRIKESPKTSTVDLVDSIHNPLRVVEVRHSAKALLRSRTHVSCFCDIFFTENELHTYVYRAIYV